MLNYILGAFVLAVLAPSAAQATPGQLIVDELKTQDKKQWLSSGIWANGAMFNVIWKPNRVTYSPEGTGAMTLVLSPCTTDDGTCANADEIWPYASGELRSRELDRTESHHYGRYEVRLKAVKGNGLITSFFTYVPLYAPASVTYNKQDEIDIELLGRTDPYNDKDQPGDEAGGSCNGNIMLQINYFREGSQNNEVRIPLDFDASADYHTYAFDWQPTYIKWYVDDELRYTYSQDSKGKVTGSAPAGHIVYDGSLPSSPGATTCKVSTTKRGSSALPHKPSRLMANFWAGRNTAEHQWFHKWSGTFTPPAGNNWALYAQYDWIKYTPSN